MIDEATLAANRLIGRRVLVELWGAGKLELADELYAPDYVDHVGRGPEPAQVRGPEGLKQAVMLFRRAFPDLHYAVEEELAERTWSGPASRRRARSRARFSARSPRVGP